MVKEENQLLQIVLWPQCMHDGTQGTGRCSCIQLMSGSVNIATCENNVFHFIIAEIMLKTMHLNEKMLCLWRITQKRRLNFCMVSGELMRNFSQRHFLLYALPSTKCMEILAALFAQELGSGQCHCRFRWSFGFSCMLQSPSSFQEYFIDLLI